ncbi:MAG: hypothetical protein JOY82_18615 [Streptosporangiaceae bacterium]|nr:hypothetical protein [Streptosporangiaceae bacterium]MBV9856497.1 hypothetical protein [Streptosporangiaceae bacterium]
MSGLEFEATAAEAYERIADAGVLDTIDAVLDGLEKDPGQDWLRRHRWSDPPLWGVTVRGRTEDYLVLWAPENRDGETIVVVYYVGPDAPRGALPGHLWERPPPVW